MPVLLGNFMDLKTGCIFWPQRDGTIATYPRLNADRECDVAIIGGGITGALSAYYLSQAGARVVVVDRREIGQGSTSASTGLLQYEIDTPLTALIQRIGRRHAQRAYRISVESIGAFAKLAGELDNDAEVVARPSLYLACEPDDADELRAEQAARREIGIDVEFITHDALRRDYGIDRPAALWSRTAMVVDPYRFTFAVFRRAAERGAEIYADTTVSQYEPESDHVCLRTDRGASILARRVIFATGYETPEFLDQNICVLKSTYALASEPIEELSSWRDECLIWESGKPYFYARTTSDKRALVGGEDEDFSDPDKRDALIGVKAQTLVEKFHALLPSLRITPDCCWAGTFAETKDGLPYIGTTEQFPLGYFALGYGGNGITFSLIAAQIIRDLYVGKPNPDMEIFRFDR